MHLDRLIPYEPGKDIDNCPFPKHIHCKGRLEIIPGRLIHAGTRCLAGQRIPESIVCQPALVSHLYIFDLLARLCYNECMASILPPFPSLPIDFWLCPDVVFGIFLKIKRKWHKTGQFTKTIANLHQILPFVTLRNEGRIVSKTKQKKIKDTEPPRGKERQGLWKGALPLHGLQWKIMNRGSKMDEVDPRLCEVKIKKPWTAPP